ncbi:extracellular sulfatase SULF-1 homolog isoform X2 [Tribolium castaneum]|uniref:extracellular sulfatase SULF-1 homolog isoform X2 n=1 Tax=Tribolium castaneum TaxID=7070 RepID=UPI00046BF7E5|nr:PREDICTED: extracellular sulfatase SULF-1 homolog isoform X2 [Tribolium castaneum]|eukprot:XP_008193092.1 PREDICTED: extracellular sulfatase SULF-1 homolog isoform X2 [Tribolium castaneum]
MPCEHPSSSAMFSAVTFFLVLATVLLPTTAADASPQRGRQRKGATFPSSPSRERKPNIVLILTDDQDVELGSLNFMPKTARAIRDQGTEFRHAYVTTPMCCPSRSSLLTGMYVHNHHVYTNNDNCSSTQWQATYETRSFATYLSNAGYRTGYFGKYLNKYNGSYVPPGWREWGGLIMNSKYYNYSINMNGKKIKHGFDYHKDYYPDLIANDSIAFLRQSKKNSAHKPVMLTMSFPAPHGPEDSAPQYSHLFFNVTTHHTPSYDYAPNPDKQWILQVTQKMQPIHKQFTDLLMTKRLQTLQSVDAAVQLIVEELRALGELDNTYIIYTSDHGYHLGQFGLIKGKSFPFEFDVRIPFLVRGPGVEPGTVVDDIVLNIDLAPTFLDIAGVEAPPHMDGRSVLPLFLNSKRKRMRWPDTFLIESSGRRETPYLDARIKARRNSTTEAPLSTLAPGDYSMATSTKFWESSTVTTTSPKKVYESGEDLALDDEDDDNEEEDIDVDEDEIDGGYDVDDDIYVYSNEANVTNKNLIRDETVLEGRSLPPANKLERLTLECAADEMKYPCRRNQKWYCINENGRWRKHKCKTLHVPLAGNKLLRKCACFTQEGLVYKTMFDRNITRRHTRIKRDTDLTHILFTLIDPDGMTSRAKRDTLDHVETVLKDVQGKIIDLKSVNTSLMQPNLVTNTISETSAGCIIMSKGRVNCSTSVYQDPKSWRQSRHQIDNEIYQLKQKLEKLKEIRRHLKHTRPLMGQADDEEDNQKNKTAKFESPDVNELNLHLGQEPKRKRKPVKINRIELTTSSPYFGHGNHHRHKHPDNDVTTSPPTRRPSTTTKTPEDYENCHCTPDPRPTKDPKHKIKEERLRKKLRKQRKRDQLEKECASERMNCFRHDKEHWKTAPMWTEGPFCFCMNANNNTYSCVRTINSTHNFLYCEFTTGLVTFYNLRIDPYELQNRIEQLKPEEKLFLHEQLKHLMACKGKACTVNHNAHQHHTKIRANVAPVVGAPHRYKKRKLVEEGGRLLPLTQSEFSPRWEYSYASKTHNKTWRRRNPWKYTWRQNKQHERTRQKQFVYDGNFKRSWH